MENNNYQDNCPECNLGKTKKMGSACGCWICPTCKRLYSCMPISIDIPVFKVGKLPPYFILEDYSI